MTKTIIHIGYPKTGTTWFTEYFYPFIKNAHISYTDDLIYSFEKGHEFLKIKSPKVFDNKELHVIIAHKFSGVEEFKWNNGFYRDFFIRQLKQNFPNATIVVFIRNQIDFLASVYSSYLTHGGTYTFRKLFKTGKLDDGTMFSFEYINYFKLIKLYQEAFGHDHVRIYIYEEFMENNQAFLEKYKKDLNFNIHLEMLNYKKYNETLRIGLAILIKTINFFNRNGVRPKKSFAHLPLAYKWMNKRRIIKLNQYRIFGKKLKKEKVLGNELINFMKEYFKESNKRLIEEFDLQSIKKYNYPL